MSDWAPGAGEYPDDLFSEQWLQNELHQEPLLQDDGPVSAQGVFLSPQQVDQALQWSRTARNEVQQWRLYGQGLALLGVEQWLQDREPNLTVQRGQGACPTDLPLLTAVTNVWVGNYRLCLLPRRLLPEVVVEVPQATVDLPDFIPHFYVVVDIQEEINYVRVAEVLSYTQLAQYHLPHFCKAVESAWTYALPLPWFTEDAEQLLLWLCCLEPAALPLPAAPDSIGLQQTDLEPLLPELHASDELWPVLSWPQGRALLYNPTLRQWLTQILQPADWVRVPEAGDLSSDAARPGWLRPINTALWMQQVLEDVAREWVLLSPTLALRSRPPEITTMLSNLEQRGVLVPEHAGIAYRELELDATYLRLYSLVWPLEEPPEHPEWTLLLVLGPQPETALHHPVQLMVRDINQILTNSVLVPESTDLYLYTQVVGAWDEQFWVTIGFDFNCSATAIQLAPFRFEPPQS